jgi:V8-like Glu-specific endopeptidase
MEEELQDLLRRAETTFGDLTPEQAIPKTRAIVGPWKIPNSQKAAAFAMAKLKSGEIPTAEELIALEYVIRVMRPAPLVESDLPGPIDREGETLHTAEVLERWKKFRKDAAAVTRAVGRIDHPHPDIGHVGTGFLVAEGVLATNRHVLLDLTGGVGVIGPDSGIKVYFRKERVGQDIDDTVAKVIGVLKKHLTEDIVLLEVESHPARPIVRLDSAGGISPGHPVVVVGYPAQPTKSNPLFSDKIFSNKYGVKRAAMGEITRTNRGTLLFHDCSTLGGNSGSPVISLEDHGVIGIHRSGGFVYRNEAVLAREIATLI